MRTFLLFAGLCLCLRAAGQGITPSDTHPLEYINTNFEGATPLDWQIEPDGAVAIRLLYDHERRSVNRASSQWLFQVQAKQGNAMQLVLESFDNIWNGKLASAITDSSFCNISVDGKNWVTVPGKRVAGNKLQLQFTMPADSVFVARIEPYGVNKLRHWLDSIRDNSLVHITSIGNTIEGRPIELLQIGNKNAPHSIFIRARAHGFETGGNWVVQGLVNRLLQADRKSTEFLKQYCLYIVPMANKDAVARGRSRFNARGVDLNRNWHQPVDSILAPENAAIERWLEQTIRAGRKPNLAIDLHNDGYGNLHICHAPDKSGYYENMDRFEKLLRQQTWFTEGSVGGRRSSFRIGSSIAEGFLHRYGIDALVFELNYEWISGLGKTPAGKDWEQLGSALAKIFYDYFNQATLSK